MSKEAMKLAQKWQQTDWNTENPMSADFAVSEANDVISALMDALRKALAEDVPETNFGNMAEQPAQQEPVLMFYEQEWQGKTSRAYQWLIDPFSLPAGAKLYTSPPAQRTWVGLMDEEIDDCARYCVKAGQSVNAAIRAIEAKLRERNA